MTTPHVTEQVLHEEEQERRIEALEEIIRVQADTIATLSRTANLAEGTLTALTLQSRVHGGQRK